VLAVVFVSLVFMSASITAEVFFVKEDLGVGDALYGFGFARAMWFTGGIGHGVTCWSAR
jgi:hypothetical protein